MNHHVKHDKIPRDDFVGKRLALCFPQHDLPVRLWPTEPRESDGKYILKSVGDTQFAPTNEPDHLVASSPEASLTQTIVDRIVAVSPESPLGIRGFHFSAQMPPEASDLGNWAELQICIGKSGRLGGLGSLATLHAHKL